MIAKTEVVWKDTFHAVGLKVPFQPSNVILPSENELSKLWIRFNPRAGEIKGCDGKCYGLCLFPPGFKPGDTFDYLAGAGVRAIEDVPEGMTAETVAGALYCVVTRQGTIDELGETFRYYWEEWLPSSADYEATCGAEVELYDERYRGNEDAASIMELWFPVKRKREAPIENRIGSAIVHVTDLRRSAEWYSRLLGLPIREERLNGGPVYWFDLPGTGLLLDDNSGNRRDPAWREDMKPRFMLPVSDIDDAYAYIRERAEIIGGGPHRFEGMAYFNFRDPEGNALMACRSEHAEEDPALAETESPVLGRIGGVFVDVRKMESAARWHSELFGLPFKPQEAEQSIYSVPMRRGASLLLDDNRARRGETFRILLMFDTRDIRASYDFVRTLGYEAFGEIEEHGDVAFFSVRDPDGNLIMICQGEA
ncbi:VOC family protein [Cohnella nanjingensis]|uniref:GyrI-like domain-containing protein n=1 Tax=Cohnella nanjingensis TaxID=1387779 RepID=A0A7X0RP22_9BACL|nr:VOC family protein [Cohnella nanjingensis]MBB6671057.1 GyrI-like domain-containing protein [Cohnella nanjingensis]